MVTTEKSVNQENLDRKLFFVGILKVTDGKSRNRICKSVVRICGSVSPLKCHGSTTTGLKNEMKSPIKVPYCLTNFCLMRYFELFKPDPDPKLFEIRYCLRICV
jgi:hypothetical protein